MPPGLQLLLPAALPAAAALLTWSAGAAGIRIGRVLAAASAWAALAVLLFLWLPGRGVQEMHGLALGSGASLRLRLDAVSFAFSLAILVPSALLLTFQRRGWRAAGASALALASAFLAITADSVLLMALFLGTAATLTLVQLRTDHERGTEAYWPAVVAGWLCLLWAGATLEVVSSTSVYAAVPVEALGAPSFLLLAAAALLTSGLVPWRPWTAEMWDRPRLLAGSFAIALLLPQGPAILLRAYALGGGRWPSIWLNLVLAAAGLATVVTAAARAQRAATRRAHRAEVVPGLGGVALMALGLGTPVGVVAAVTTILAAAVLGAMLALLPEDTVAVPAVGMALAAGTPPTLTFVAMLLAIQAALEAGDAWAFLGVGLGLAWLVTAAAAARAVRLPAYGRAAEPSASLPGAALAGGVVLLAGALAGPVVNGISVPAVAEVMTFPVGAVTVSPFLVATISGAWPAVALGAPVIILLAAVAAASHLRPWRATGAERLGAAGPPFFRVPWEGYGERLADRLGALRLPEEYRSLLDFAAIEATMARGQPVLWAVLLLVLAVAVNR